MSRTARVALTATLAALLFASAARAAEPIFVLTPEPDPPPAPIVPPPTGYLDGPCGLAVDSAGRFYVSDHRHGVVDLYDSSPNYLAQLALPATTEGPCELALGPGGELYVNEYHRAVRKFGPPPGFVPGPTIAGAGVDGSHPTGVAVDPATGRVYVDERTRVTAYEPDGSPVEVGGEPLVIGAGSLEDGYGLAVSAYPGTEGLLYLADAATKTVKVYDPAIDIANPVESIAGPPGGFNSLRDSALAVDRASGNIYVLDNLQPGALSRPLGLVEVFDSSGSHLGHLPYEVIHGGPSGLAVDNSAGPSQGRVYLTSGNGQIGGIYAYPPGAQSTEAPKGPLTPRLAAVTGTIDPTLPIGGPAPGGGGTRIECEGDACQVLPPEPADPALTTLLRGPGNPKLRYVKARRRHPRAHHHRKRRHGHKRRYGAGGARASSAAAAAQAPSGGADAAASASASGPAASPSPIASVGPPPGEGGFGVEALDTEGEAATLAGSHPYQLSFGVGLEQGGGEADLRALRLELPAGLLADPAATPGLCSAAQFQTPRSSAFEASLSGESCPEASQVGTVEVEGGLGPPRRFGLFDLDPPGPAALVLAASPYGQPLLLSGRIGTADAHLTLAGEVPEALRAERLTLTVWGAPWENAHDTERGDCLNEAEPAFGWCKHQVGQPTPAGPLAFLTLPARCAPALDFSATIGSWQEPTEASYEAQNPGAGGSSTPLTGCAALPFDPDVEGLLSTKKASSASGFVFRLTDSEDPGLSNPRLRVRAQPRRLSVALPAGVTLNPSMAAGLGVCEPAQYRAESAANAAGAGCPGSAKIGAFRVRSPFYEGLLRGSVYLAAPQRNPFGSLLALYLVAKAADRDVLIKAAGEIEADPASGDLKATFEDLPQLPYSQLEVELRSGQRAPLVSPGFCGAATTRIELSSWAREDVVGAASNSPIETGIDGGPCPGGGAPPFSPGVHAGGVNSNVASYTPYFVHLTRRDTEGELTSYSLELPKGITGKLAGIPQCPDAAIAAARAKSGFGEAASPSCPSASAVGRTLTGYGIGAALTYAEGRIYLAGPYHGAPLSLVTINPATVGPFDLGTIVIRSAFAVDPATAQLQIDSRASDRIPHILAGIPLHLRDVRVYIDRPQFTHNPSSCEPSQLVSTLTGAGADLGSPADDSSATVTEHFQLLNCRTLGFAPKLGLRLRGATRRGGFPALRASYASRGARDSNLRRIEVEMPHQLFLAQNHIRKVCTRVQFATEACPAGSVYGKAVAATPLLDEPLRGNVYLRSSEHKLPDLIADLHAGSIQIVLAGRIGPSKQGGIRAFFDAVPDAPIERFTMTLGGGRHGLLTNSVDVCAHPPVAVVRALGQNNLGRVFSAELRGRCEGAKGAKRGKGPKHAHERNPKRATARASEIVQKGELRVKSTGRLTPRALPRHGAAPVAVTLGGEIATADGSLPPQLQSMRIELNRHGRLETKGLPRCRVAQIQPASTAAALAACRSSLVGQGSFSVAVVLGGQKPYPTSGRLLVFNATYKGRPALLGQIYSAHPFASSFVIPFTIARHSRGRYGLALSAVLPRALTAWGHLTGLSMRLSRSYSYGGRRRSFLSAGCPAPEGFPGALFELARTRFSFAGGERITATLTKSCRVRG